MRTKEFLAVRGIAFESVNVAAEPERVAELQAKGVRSLPAVGKGDEIIASPNISDVAAFLGIEFDDTPELPPEKLAERLAFFLDTAESCVRQLPPEKSAARLAYRDWPYWKLAHHAFHITDLFLQLCAGAVIEKASFAVDPAEDMKHLGRLADYGAAERRRFEDWWRTDGQAIDPAAPVPFEGRTRSLHQAFERTAWHTCQHVRQLVDVLDSEGIAPDRRLAREDWAGLPVPESIWAD